MIKFSEENTNVNISGLESNNGSSAITLKYKQLKKHNKQINGTQPKCPSFVLPRTPLTKSKDKPLNGRKYLQVICKEHAFRLCEKFLQLK